MQLSHISIEYSFGFAIARKLESTAGVPSLLRRIRELFRFASNVGLARASAKKGSQRPSFLAAAKPICIHYNKKWKAPSEKFERAPPAYQLPLNFILFKGGTYPRPLLHPPASARLFPHPPSFTALPLPYVAGKVSP